MEHLLTNNILNREQKGVVGVQEKISLVIIAVAFGHIEVGDLNTPFNKKIQLPQ